MILSWPINKFIIDWLPTVMTGVCLCVCVCVVVVVCLFEVGFFVVFVCLVWGFLGEGGEGV